MKNIILLFLSLFTTSLIGQYAYLESKNLLLIYPTAIEQLTPAIINHFETTYHGLMPELEKDLNTARIGGDLETIEKDIELLSICIEEWEWVKSKDKTEQFLSSFDSNNCYDIFSEDGEPVLEFDIIKAENIEINLVQTQKIIKLIRKPKYTRIVDPDCKSPKAKDCIKTCMQELPPLYEMTSNDEKISFETLPSNWRINEDNTELIYEANLQASHQIINLETGHEVSISKWLEVDCF